MIGVRVPIGFPQTQGRPGGVGPAGAPGAPGVAGPVGAQGAPGVVDIRSVDLSEAELSAMNVTPISLTPDVAGMIQVPLWWFIEISKTVAGAANPSMEILWRGTPTLAAPSTTVGLTTVEISWRFVPATALANNTAGSPNTPIPIEGNGLEIQWGSNPGAVFRATARVSVAIVTVPAVFP